MIPEAGVERHGKSGRRQRAGRLAGLVAAGLLVAACKSAPATLTPQENQQAVQFEQQQNWSGLLALAQKGIQEDSSDGWAWWYAGIADDGLGRKPDAVTAYQKAFPLMTGINRNAIAQELAADYAALNESSQLQALIQQLQKTDPQEAASLKAQFSGALQFGTAPAATTTAAGGRGLPDISPQSLSALETKVRANWRSDAVPVRVTVDAMDGGGFQTAYDFYSRSTKTGETVTVSSTTTGAGVQNPPWGTAAIPANFVPLATAMGQVSDGSGNGLELATLLWQAGTTNPVNLVWSIAEKTGNGDAALLPAYVMTAAQLQQLESAAGSGNASAEYVLGEVYAVGIAGTMNAGLAAQWVAKAAQAGNVLAENKLGQFEQLGFGTATNATVAAQWYAKAAQAGYAPAEFNLGLLYETGMGVTQNWIAASQWITAAAHQGLQPAVLELNYVSNTAKRVEHAQQLAAAQQGSSSGGCGPGMHRFNANQCAWNPGIVNEVIHQETTGSID
ncbi:MAG TPA: tetratricopeptide repeat protein [Acidobacteriaceae bacterium]|jgi:hypothetical protein|nr:tetratricopeptide repeat protein [Acidobacteriaceae bacterium]